MFEPCNIFSNDSSVKILFKVYLKLLLIRNLSLKSSYPFNGHPVFRDMFIILYLKNQDYISNNSDYYLNNCTNVNQRQNMKINIVMNYIRTLLCFN